MLIHLGNNEFVDLADCVAILDISVIDAETRGKILHALSGKVDFKPRTAVLTVDGKWLGSSLSSEAIAQRGIANPIAKAWYAQANHDSKECFGRHEEVDSGENT